MRSVRLDLHFHPGPLSAPGQQRFRSGELLSGWLDVECPEPTPCRALTVHVQPRVLGPSLPQGYYPVPPSLLFRGELPAGRHRFPFSLRMPVGPVSYEGEFGSLSWRLQAHLDRGAPMHDLLLPAGTDERFQLVPPRPHAFGGESSEPSEVELTGERLGPRRQVPWLDEAADPGFLASLANDLRRVLGRAAPLMLAPKVLSLGDAFDVYCLWPRGWAAPKRVDVEVFAQESRVTYYRSYIPPLIERAYPFGVAADLEPVPVESVGAISDTARKQFGAALHARLQLPLDALPTHPLISWGVRLRARSAGKKPGNVVGKGRLWECERDLHVAPWWEGAVVRGAVVRGAVGKGAGSASQSLALPVAEAPRGDKSAEVSVAA